jgi:hypothetical protein
VEKPDFELIGWIVGGCVTASAAAIGFIKKVGVRLATPKFIEEFSGVNARLDIQTRVLNDISITLARQDERVNAIDRRITRLENRL